MWIAEAGDIGTAVFTIVAVAMALAVFFAVVRLRERTLFLVDESPGVFQISSNPSSHYLAQFEAKKLEARADYFGMWIEVDSEPHAGFTVLVPRNEVMVAESWATDTIRQVLSQIVELNDKADQHHDDVLTVVEVVGTGRVFLHYCGYYGVDIRVEMAAVQNCDEFRIVEFKHEEPIPEWGEPEV